MSAEKFLRDKSGQSIMWRAMAVNHPDQFKEVWQTMEQYANQSNQFKSTPIQQNGLREAAEKVVKYCDEWDETPFKLQMIVEELEEALNQNK